MRKSGKLCMRGRPFTASDSTCEVTPLALTMAL